MTDYEFSYTVSVLILKNKKVSLKTIQKESGQDITKEELTKHLRRSLDRMEKQLPKIEKEYNDWLSIN